MFNRRPSWTSKPKTSEPALAPTLKPKYRSKLEEKIAKQLETAGIHIRYEDTKVPYVIPSRTAKYTPDFGLTPEIFIEGKGRFRTASDRHKLILVKEQNPGLDIRIVFQKADNPIYKGSPTTNAKWAEEHGFLWSDKGTIPPEWLEEAKASPKHVG